MNEQQIRWNEEELTEIVRSIPFSVLRNTAKMAQWCMEREYTNIEIANILTFAGVAIPLYRELDFVEKPQSTLTFGEVCDMYDRAQVQFVIITRCNYLLHQSMIAVYDLLESQKRLRFMVKKHSQRAEEVWDGYEKPRQRTCEKSAWYTLQDHLRITQDILQPYLDKVYESLRDYFICFGWKDIEVKARIELALLLAKVCRHSFKAFFKDFKDACGVDFAPLFKSADLSQMVRYFTMMVESLGFKTETDEFGLPDIKGFNPTPIRVKWAWKNFIKDLQDNDLMDESALRAINLNPKTKADYELQLAEDAQKQLDEGIDKLSEKFKVTKKK